MRTQLTHLKKGFTLIELLVVIAIIGILAGIVLVSLGTARNKGKDSAVQEELSGLRSQMEIFYTAGSTYVGGCTAAEAAGAILDAARGQTGATFAAVNAVETAGTVACDNAAGTWAAQAPLTTVGQYWCVDSTGASKQSGTLLAAGAVSC